MKRPNRRRTTPVVAPGLNKKHESESQVVEPASGILPRKTAEAGVAERNPAYRTRGVLTFAMGACAMYYVFVVASAYGDFQGDSWEYLSIASAMKKGLFTLASYNYLRGILYPWFLSVTWGHSGFLTYFIQVTLFLTSLFLALRTLAFDSIYCLLPIGAALIPAIVFLQRQIYPDGVLISLTLLFLVCLTKRHWTLCVVLGLLLGLTKIIFLCVIPVGLVVLMLTKRIIGLKAIVWSIAAALLSLPVCVVLFSYVFVDLGYMVAFARPYSHGYSLERVFPARELQVTCSGIKRSIPRRDLYFDPITVPFAVADYGPLTREQAGSLGCTTADLRSLKRNLIMQAFARNPLLHAELAAEHFGQSLVGAYQVDHVSYILRYRQDLWLTHYDELSYFSPAEVRLLGLYNNNGFPIKEKERPLSFVFNEFSSNWGEKLLRIAALCVLGFCVILAFRRGRLEELAHDPANIGIAMFLVVYSYLVGLSAPFLYDRYTYVNLVILCLFAARFAAIVLAPKAFAMRPLTALGTSDDRH
jgi:hypothetical protein